MKEKVLNRMPTHFPGSAVSGILHDGQVIRQYTLSGKGDLVLKVIDLGAAITHLLVPDGRGNMTDVVLGYHDLASYPNDTFYMGCVIGRVAGRIRDARVSLEGKIHALTRNEGSNHLHGGVRGLHKSVWTPAEIRTSQSDVSLCLACTSPSNDEGYPGQLMIKVQYTITVRNELRIEFEATTNQATPYSVTQHTYFNLSGAGDEIDDHKLQIYSDFYAPLDHDMTVVDHLEPLKGKANDLRQPRLLRDVIPHLDCQHGDLYRIKSQGRARLKRAARLMHTSTGIAMDVYTTWSYLQFYTGKGLDGTAIGKSRSPYHPYAGLCLECEDYPNGVNAPYMGPCILKPRIRRKDVTMFSFSSDRISNARFASSRVQGLPPSARSTGKHRSSEGRCS